MADIKRREQKSGNIQTKVQKGKVWTAKGYVNLLAPLQIYSGDDDTADDDVEQQPTLNYLRLSCNLLQREDLR